MKTLRAKTEARRLEITLEAIRHGANTSKRLADEWKISEAHACEYLVQAVRSGVATRTCLDNGRGRAFVYSVTA